jgi:hypothetical protein
MEEKSKALRGNDFDAFQYYLHSMEAINQELTHQLVLWKLLNAPKFVKAISGLRGNIIVVEKEPFRGLFDLSVKADRQEAYLELKMWSPLHANQIDRQTRFLLADTSRIGLYLLLGISRFEWSEDDILEASGGLSRKITYPELIAAIDTFLAAAEPSPLKDLAMSYRSALQEQFEWSQNAWRYPVEKGRALHYLSAYEAIQKSIPDIPTRIYSFSQGGTDYVLKAETLRRPYGIGGITGEIFLEIHNGELCIKFDCDTNDKETLRAIRWRLIEYFDSNLRQRSYDVNTRGRISRYMRLVSMPLDFPKIEVKRAAEIFKEWHDLVKDFYLE